ncbi:uncharacterized protein LOC127861370 [Dreissena polymorpha]|nr:uncharacterized protein LOC127861370 [Dreissena polymorpha]KAH3695058.1 hypothetical protein DPMN_082508 [Dreissena polymorpha]
MMAFGKRIYVIVCLYLCLIAKGSGYYISSTSETWQAAGTYCEHAQPKYQYKGSGVLELNDTIEIDGDIPEAGVWIGYFKAFTEFEFEGCGMNNTGNITYTVYSLAQCHHLCGGTHIGLIGATSLNSDPLKMTCVCINTLTYYLINNICISCGDIICGKDTRRAVYSVLPDTTSEERTDDFNYLCKVSTSNPNASAWVHCSDTYTSNTRGVWCRQNESAQPFVSGISFSA